MAYQNKLPFKLQKYWHQRYNLFSRYDDGVKLDEEAWWSVTPENIAQHIAQRILDTLGGGHHVVVDGFCGVGGNLIQFALHSPHVRVIGCDIDPNRLRMAKHNAKVYGVQHQCDFIHGDFLDLMPSLLKNRVDSVFLSPPWGGAGYKTIEKYSLDMMQPNGFEVVRMCRKHLTNNIAFLMPRNVDIAEVGKELLDKYNPEFECEQNMVGTKIKTITVYFGGLVAEGIELEDEEDEVDEDGDVHDDDDDDDHDHDDDENDISDQLPPNGRNLCRRHF